MTDTNVGNVISFKDTHDRKIEERVKDKLCNHIERIPELHELLGCNGCTKVKYKGFWTGDISQDLADLKDSDILIIYGSGYSPILTPEEEAICLRRGEE